jgi:hypothetical protein
MCRRATSAYIALHAEVAVRRLPAAHEAVRARARRTLALRRRRLQRRIGEDARDRGADAGGDRLRGVLDHRRRRRAAEAHRRGETEVAEAHRLLELERPHAEVVPREARVQEEPSRSVALEAASSSASRRRRPRSRARCCRTPSLRRDAEAGDRGRSAERVRGIVTVLRRARRRGQGSGGRSMRRAVRRQSIAPLDPR